MAFITNKEKAKKMKILSQSNVGKQIWISIFSLINIIAFIAIAAVFGVLASHGDLTNDASEVIMTQTTAWIVMGVFTALALANFIGLAMLWSMKSAGKAAKTYTELLSAGNVKASTVKKATKK